MFKGLLELWISHISLVYFSALLGVNNCTFGSCMLTSVRVLVFGSDYAYIFPS